MIKALIFSIYFIFSQLILSPILKRTPRYCKEDKKIPIYHILTAVISSMMLFFFGWSMEALRGTAFFLILMYASVCDIQTHEVKDFVSVMIVLVALIGIKITDLPLMFIAGVFVFTLLFISAVVSGNRLGGADVKLSAACAFLLGLQKSIAGLVIGLFLAVICNLILSRKEKTMGKAFPLVPYLSIGFTAMYFI